MTGQIRTVQDCAAEAEFQLLCAKDQMNWLIALARAIQLAHTHGRGEIGEGLTELANYLSDTCFGNTTAAIRGFSELSRLPVELTETELSELGASNAGGAV
ncbi:hypothetical protein PSCICJ_48140 [Pseudomonas cichorii]|uniref:hypothetical protein n=1 Tax=Pseudomonas cichorii TaxID=36746 RepID=UPI00190FDED4|nr:hypothetical protein [Pseudomonas cichorii]GFM68696.1 hypothetical protein PSCICJ_48140 [Pseudomonas cichorii]